MNKVLICYLVLTYLIGIGYAVTLKINFGIDRAIVGFIFSPILIPIRLGVMMGVRSC